MEYLIEALRDLLKRHFYSNILLEINESWINASIQEKLEEKSFRPNVDHFKDSLDIILANPCIYHGKKTKVKAIRPMYMTYH